MTRLMTVLAGNPELPSLSIGQTLVVSITCVFVLAFAMIVMMLRVQRKRARRKAEAARSWPSTQGRVIHSAIVEHHDQDQWIEPRVVFEYVVGGVRYESRQIRAGGGQSRFGRSAEVVAHYQAGLQVDVYYNPANPADAALEV